MSTIFKSVRDFMPDEASLADLRTLPCVPHVAAFENFLRTAKTPRRNVATTAMDYAQLEIEKLSVVVQAMQDCLRHHRGELPREEQAYCKCGVANVYDSATHKWVKNHNCNGCGAARCVDGRSFDIPADAATYTIGEVS